jgi:hypothetical protein
MKVVEKKKDGIVVRGGEDQHQRRLRQPTNSSSFPSPPIQRKKEITRSPSPFRPDTKGITFVCQYTPFSAEKSFRLRHGRELGNPLFRPARDVDGDL